MSERHFKVLHARRENGCATKHDVDGRYSGTPSRAASKAFTKLCARKKIRGVCTLYVIVQETTQGSTKKVKCYRCSRRKIKNPNEHQKNFGIKYLSTCKACKPEDIPNCPKAYKGKTSGPMKGL